MTTETKLRGGLALTLLSLTILGFYFNKQYEELEKCKIGSSFIQGGDIQKEVLLDRIDSLHDELFNAVHENGIEELVLDSLFIKYPKLKKEHDNIKFESNLFE